MTDLPDYMKPKDLTPSPYKPPAKPYGTMAQAHLDELEAAIAKHSQEGQDPIVTIKGWLKRLTHRQMRTVCEEIFNSAKGVTSTKDLTDAISKTELPDVLDRWAYGE